MSQSFSNLDRRSMLLGSGLMIAGLATVRPTHAGAAPQISEEDKQLRLLTTDPRNGEPDLGQLVQSWITPTELFYVRSHAPNPQIEINDYRLSVDGLVQKELSLSFEDLKSFPEVEITATLTCAGNRRIEFNQENPVGGVQWGPGAIGNATWTGIRLADVLEQAGVDPGAKHVCFEGLDEIKQGEETIGFGASIPIAKVQSSSGDASIPGAMLVYAMNGEPLAADHGFPVRTLVPGYIGARSVKWLGKVVLSDRPSPNHYVQSAYKIVPAAEALAWEEAGPIYRYPINTAFAWDEEVEVEAGTLRLGGYVLPSGLAGTSVRSVQVSADGGHRWVDAELVGEESEYCWRLWQAEIDVTSDTKELVARARDSSGAFTPSRVPWNAKGYLQNSWYRVPVKVRS